MVVHVRKHRKVYRPSGCPATLKPGIYQVKKHVEFMYHRHCVLVLMGTEWCKVCPK